MKDSDDELFIKDYLPEKNPCKGCHTSFEENECGLCEDYLEAFAWYSVHEKNKKELS